MCLVKLCLKRTKKRYASFLRLVFATKEKNANSAMNFRMKFLTKIKNNKKRMLWKIKQIYLWIKDKLCLAKEITLIIGVINNFMKSWISIRTSILTVLLVIKFVNIFSKQLKREFMVGCGFVRTDMNVNSSIAFQKDTFSKIRNKNLKKRFLNMTSSLIRLTLKEINQVINSHQLPKRASKHGQSKEELDNKKSEQKEQKPKTNKWVSLVRTKD